MVDVIAFTSGENTPSSRYRVRQHIPHMKELGVHVSEWYPPIDRNAQSPFGVKPVWKTIKAAATLPVIFKGNGNDLIWLERTLCPGLLTFEPLFKRPFVLDIDDSVWLLPPFGAGALAAIARRALAIVAGNRYIARWLGRHNRAIHVVPTAVDTDRFRPNTERRKGSGRFIAGWSGTSSNLKYLYAIEPALRAFLSNPDTIVRVVCDQKPRFSAIAEEKVEFIPWTPLSEINAIRGMDVGLMPLADTPWTRGKCGFKMLQYMSCAIPVVVSPVGMNREILALGSFGAAARSPGEWSDALRRYYSDPGLCAANGKVARRIVQNHFSRERISRELAEIFRGLA